MDFETYVSRQSLKLERWPAYVVDAAGVMVHVNDACDRVAHEAGGLRELCRDLYYCIMGRRFLARRERRNHAH